MKQSFINLSLLFGLTFLVSCIQHQQLSSDGGEVSIDESHYDEIFFDEQEFLAFSNSEESFSELSFTQSEDEWLEEINLNEIVVDEVYLLESAPNLYGLNSTTHIARGGETLMQIAFKYYSDFSRWKEIAAWNQDRIRGSQISTGTQLVLQGPFRQYQRPTGRPYLIKPGDTLGVISRKVYGTPKEWQSIWNNNRNQVHDPNLIFAGFTLFYRPGNQPENDFDLTPF